MSLIVVEGCDGSGKSTLLENARIEIPKRYFLQVRHSCRPLSPVHIRDFLTMVEPAGEYLNIMIDRHPLISEPIYANILRGGNDLTLQYPDWLTFEDRAKHLARTVNRVIYCRPSFEAIRRNVSVNPQLAGVVDKLPFLVEAYDRTMRDLLKDVPVIHFDYQFQDRTLEELFFGKI